MDTSFLIAKKIREQGLFARKDKVLIGLSGGVDSCVLLDVLCQLSKEIGFKVTAAHVNYHLRGKDSDRDEKFVRKLAKKYGVKLFVKKNPPQPPFFKGGQRPGYTPLCKGGRGGISNIQNLAREIRFDFFLKTAKKNKLNKIALAHHLDDQAETVILHIVRGSGIEGLCGMSAEREFVKGISLLRPLLPFSKDQLISYAKEKGLHFVEDRTNLTKKYSRNIVRLNILPMMAKMNPNVAERISKTAEILSSENDYISSAAGNFLVKYAKVGGKEVSFVRDRITELHPALQRRVIRKAFERLTGGTKDLQTDHIDKILQVINSRSKKIGEYFLPNCVKFARKDDKITLRSYV